MGILSEWYDRRIVNVNVNIVVAGLLALIPTTAAASAAKNLLEIHTPIFITAITFIVDAVADVLVYYLLHWWANHATPSPRRVVRSYAYSKMSFVKDATLVQFERACLSPLLYAIALGLQYTLMHNDVRVEWATIIGYLTAILVTRVLHTIYMYRAEVKARELQLSVLRERGIDVTSLTESQIFDRGSDARWTSSQQPTDGGLRGRARDDTPRR